METPTKEKKWSCPRVISVQYTLERKCEPVEGWKREDVIHSSVLYCYIHEHTLYSGNFAKYKSPLKLSFSVLNFDVILFRVNYSIIYLDSCTYALMPR